MCINIWSWYGKVLKNFIVIVIFCFIFFQLFFMEMDLEVVLEFKKRFFFFREYGIGKLLI